jgi:rhodanese-related sulfurtransferase
MPSTITATALSARFTQGACQLIDVREPVEHAEEHIAGARLIPLGELERRSSELDRSQPVIFMCRAGSRGQQAMSKLQALGFSDVCNLEGGILAWAAAGQAIVRGERKVIPLMRQVQIVIGSCVLGGCLLALKVDPRFIGIPMFFGAGMIFAGTTGWCGLALLMAKMPWNNKAACACG